MSPSSLKPPEDRREPRWGLAPMEGVSDFATRLWFWCVSQPAAMGTPFLRVTPGFPPNRVPQLFAPEDHQLARELPWTLRPQLMASDPVDFGRIARALLQRSPLIEVNCGCPSPTVVGNGAGSSLLRSLDLFDSFIGGCSREVGAQSLAVKMRTGFSDAGSFSELLSCLRAYPIARLTVHGRTRDQRYTGLADWTLIRLAGETLKLPVIGSGDIVDLSTANSRMESAPSVHGFVVGRGALRNPWIFRILREQKNLSVPLHVLTRALALFMKLQHLQLENPTVLLNLAPRLASLTTTLDTMSHGFWEEIQFELQKGIDLETPLSPRAFARTKMLWHYLRSSLPGIFRDPTLLRSIDITGLTSHIESIAKTSGITDIALTWDPSDDWIYSGEKHKKSGESSP
jgi:tRNA-dihydrouridine synthase